MLIVGAEVEGRSPVDVRVADGRIAELGTGLPRRAGEAVWDAAGGALLPGLHDHHVHLLALAAAQASVRCGPPEVRDREGLARALRAAPAADLWVRGVGYHESVCGPLDRTALDALLADRPVRVQHRSGALWVLNSAGVERLGLDRGVDAAGVERLGLDRGVDVPAVEQLGLDRGADAPGVERDGEGRATGRLLRLDAWLRERLGPQPEPDLSAVGRRLASFGVTGVTDATVSNGPQELHALEAALENGALRQHVLMMGGDDLPLPTHPLLERGPRKVMLAETELPPFEELVASFEKSHAAGRPVAVHCVTRAELVFAVEAFREAGCRLGDRLEHAAVTPPELLERVAALPLSVVTQPNFVSERGDAYLVDVEPRDRPWLYRARAFRRAGVPLGAGTDAPFGADDPWRAMRAAVERRTEAGEPLGAGEALSPEEALALFTTPAAAPGGEPRRVAPGQPADLCLLDRPWRDARGALSSQHLRAAWRGGCAISPHEEVERCGARSGRTTPGAQAR